MDGKAGSSEIWDNERKENKKIQDMDPKEWFDFYLKMHIKGFKQVGYEVEIKKKDGIDRKEE